MIIQLFAILDLLVIGGVFLASYGIGKSMVSILLLLFFIKSFLFLPNVASIIDIMAGLILVFAFFGFFNILTWIAFIWILQKALFSFFS